MSAIARGDRAAVLHWVASLDRVRARCFGHYALDIYLPFSRLARALRRRSRALRGRETSSDGQTRLPRVAWSRALPRMPIRLVETTKRDGNVHLSELAILAQAAARTRPGSIIVEIGTFDGRTALNLAVNAPNGVPVVTLDLPANQPTAYRLAEAELRFTEKPAPGERLRSCKMAWRTYAQRVTQLLGDSATFDWSHHLDKAGLVFVDGSHSYDYARADSAIALRLVRPRGLVIWHDYGVGTK